MTANKKNSQEQKKVKRPTALKRDIQNKKRNLINRMLESKVGTAIRSFKTSIQNKDSKDLIQKKLNLVYQLMDKGCKKNIFKKNKAARTKSRLTNLCK